MKTTQKGFTLVEIAIVLVIIGLLLGGILKGQEMIVQARIKNVIADMTGVSAAMYGYQDRYRALPGDDPNATRWGTTQPGNNTGMVDGAYNVACPAAPAVGTAESCLFWHHLRLAGFVAGTGSQQPFNAVQGLLGVQTGNGVVPVAPVLAGGAAAPGFVSLVVCSSNLPEKIAIAADSQMDDGDARTGTVRAQLHTAGPNPAINAAADAANYAETGANIYTVCRTL